MSEEDYEEYFNIDGEMDEADWAVKRRLEEIENVI